ncbi:uncharacterized protein EKO05_0008915 [Ascochyta rabiei]|nr:uncharacterized protein EKO05_0008915 [Ascochyta rabiei]UPX18622.1 hypothetical protein EKO05_0008915 [Ascochyta rabiei]
MNSVRALGFSSRIAHISARGRISKPLATLLITRIGIHGGSMQRRHPYHVTHLEEGHESQHHKQQKRHPSTSTEANQTMSSPEAPQVRQDLSALFTALEQSFTATKLGSERWYLATLAALVGGTEPEFADQLYLHLTQQAGYASTEARQALVRRLREGLVKLTSIVGVCKPLEAVLAISKVERAEDRDFSFTRRAWTADAENHQRGAEWLGKIYAGNTEDTLALFDAHRDFRWISTEITYGLYLSDRQVLDDWDTEVVVLAGIMVQNLRLETKWHIRGARRVGMSMEDVKAVMACVRTVAQFTDVKLSRIPSVEEVEHEV